MCALIDEERRTLVNLKVKVRSLLYNVWQPQYNPGVLRARASSRRVLESCLEPWICCEYTAG
ncbi:hypothetical protein COMA1_20179 [Candidatus Nitrospira nitrosa]|uniref:Uncharacterized protein n=1 Tax=Candidatus Nitrospira nitrosa TaxID=1742972 RepID=A0A0S4LEW2_9BACT|nr:hypothetical protein COMA1_20179 [Candidatus Nitrospira nitrosa]